MNVTSDRVRYTLAAWQREFICDACAELQTINFNRTEEVIALLLNFLPEVQLCSDRWQQVFVGGHERTIERALPTIPFCDAVEKAIQFDDMNGCISRLLYRLEPREERHV